MSTESLVVDCHAVAGRGRSWCEPAHDVSYDLTELMDRGAEAGIDRHCIVPARQETYEGANTTVADLAAEHPERLIGFAAHSPEREAGKVAALLTSEVQTMGMRAVRSDGPPSRELMDAAKRLGIPVIYLPEMKPWGIGPARWYHVLAETYPSVPLILPHLGQYRSISWWAHMEAIDLAKRYPNVYLDTSGIGSLKYLERAARELPIGRLLFGTYGPELDPRVERHAIRLLGLQADQESKVLGKNILQLIE